MWRRSIITDKSVIIRVFNINIRDFIVLRVSNLRFVAVEENVVGVEDLHFVDDDASSEVGLELEQVHDLVAGGVDPDAGGADGLRRRGGLGGHGESQVHYEDRDEHHG